MTARSDHAGRNVLLVGLALLLLASCRADRDDPPVKRPPVSASNEVPRYTIEEIRALSAIGNYLPKLDEGRLRVAPPAGWDVAPRSKDYVVRFVLDRDLPTPLPRITLEAQEADFDEPRQLDEEHLPQFVQKMANRLGQRTDHEVAPLMLGSVPCAHYMMRKRFRFGGKTVAAECDVIQTLQNGRIYTLTLDVYSGKLIDYRADAYVVMAHIEFLDRENQLDDTASDIESGETEETQPAPEGPDQ